MGENNKLTSEKIRLLTREQLGLLIRGELFMQTGLEENDIHHLLSNNNGVTTGAAGEGCTKAFSCFCKRLLEVTMEDKSLHKGMTDKQKKKSLKSTFMKQKVEIEKEIRDFIKEQQNQGGGAGATAVTPVEQTEKSQISNDDELPLSEMKRKKDRADNDDESSCASDAGTTKSRDKDKRVGRKKKSKKEKKKRKKKSKLHEDDTMHGQDIESNGIVPAAVSTHVAYDGDSPTLGEDQLEQMRLAKEQFEKEKQKRINSMPKENVKGFRKIGFGKWGKTSLPIIQLSPYDVEDGDVRAAYFKMLEKTKVNKRTPTRLVFWYGCTWENRSEAYSFLSPNKILDYEIGKKEGLDKLSPVVEKKLAQGKPLTNKEDSFVQALTQMKNDLDLPPEKRIAWMIQFKESYETMFDQDSDIEMDVDIEQEEAIKNKKKPKKRGRKPKLKTNRTIHSDSEDELEGKNNVKAEIVAEKPKQKTPGKKRGRKSNAEKEAERLAEIARQEAEAAAIAAEAKNASPEPVFKSTASDSDVSMPSSDDEDDDDYSDGGGFNKKNTSKKKKQKLKTAAVDSSSPKKKKKRKMKHTAEGEETEKITKGKKRKSKASESGNELAVTTPTSIEKKSKKRLVKRIKVEQNNDSSSSSSDDADMESYDEKEHAVEQLRFEECEKEISPILKEINIVVDQDNQEKLISLFRNLKSKLNIITNAYMENTDMPAIIKKVSKRYKHSSSDVVEIVKDCRSELKTRYQNGSVPKGFKPKRKKIPINSEDSQDHNPIDHVTTKSEQPSSNGGDVSISVPTSSKIVSNPNSPTEKNKVIAEDEKNPMHNSNYSFTIPTKNCSSEKEKHPPQQQRSVQSLPLTPAPSAIKAQQQAAQKKPKKFSLTNLISGPSKPAPTEQVKEPHQTTSVPSNASRNKPLSSIQPKTKSTQIPKWLTTSSESSSSSSPPNMVSPTSTESDEDRSFAFDYLCDALQNSAIQTTTSSSTISPQASTPPTANKINVKAGARVLEDAIYRFSSNKNSDFYWEKVHDVCTFFRGGAQGRSSAKMMDQLSDPASFIKLSRSAMLEEIMDSS